MGYSKSKSLREIPIHLICNVQNLDNGGSITTVHVVHVFRVPKTAEREEYQQGLIKVKGRKIKTIGTSSANWKLWQKCILRVENYDDLDQGDPNWHSYFVDGVERIQAEDAIDKLMEVISTDEGDEEKKLEPYSGQSSGTPKKVTPTPTT